MEEEVERLRKELKNRDKDTYLAGVFGKQLLEERAKLLNQIEEVTCQKEFLEQQRHSYQLDLETQAQAVRNQASELEIQRQQVDNLSKNLASLQKENKTLHQKIENLLKENQDLKKTQEEIQLKNLSLKNKITVLEEQIKQFQNQLDVSQSDCIREDHLQLQNDIDSLIIKNKELLDRLSEMQYEIENAKTRESKLTHLVEELERDNYEKDKEISSYSVEVKKAKEEAAELQGEIEILKFEKIDANSRGNSVFAELDDRRKFVEKEYKLLDKKYQHIFKCYKENKKELDKARGQVAGLSSIPSREYQQSYIKKLENANASARKDIYDLNIKLSKLIKDKQESGLHSGSSSDKYDFLRILLQQSREKENSLENELIKLRIRNMTDNEKLSEAQCQLYQAKEDLDTAREEIKELKLQIKDILSRPSASLNENSITEKQPNIEMLLGFKHPGNEDIPQMIDRTQPEVLVTQDIIDGEFELFEDGFRETRRPRKSNKWVLREFNKISIDEPTKLSPEIKKEITSKEETVSANEKVHIKPFNPKITNYTKGASNENVNYDSCAQQ